MIGAAGGASVEEALVAYEGITDADGNIGGTTLKCSAIGSGSLYPNFDGNQIMLTSGAYEGQARNIHGATNGDIPGTITVAKAFDGKVLSNTSFIITGIRTASADVAAIQEDLGDFSGQSNLKNLLAVLGSSWNTDNKTVYVKLVTDLLAHGTHGLAVQNTYHWDKDISAYTGAKAGTYLKMLRDDWIDGGRLDLILDAILVDTVQIADGTLPASPTAGSLARFIASGGTALGTQLAVNKSVIDAIGHTGSAILASGIAMELRRGTGTQIPDNKGIYDYLQYLTGNAYTRLGAPAGTSIAADVLVIKDLIDSAEAAGPYSYLDAGGEQDVYEDTAITRRHVYLDASNRNMAQTGTFRIYRKIDGTNYDLYTSQPVKIIAGSDRAWDVEFTTNQHWKITYEEDVDEGTARDIPYNIITQVIE